MKKIILGTDWWTDCDDAVAVRLLCRAAKAGEIDFQGIIINACMEHSVASMKNFLNAEGMAQLPVGIDLEATDFIGKPSYQKGLAALGEPIANESAEDGVALYRRLLANAEDKIDIIEIGFMNVVAALLESGPDEISPKTGMELVSEKVGRFWVMAGKWDDNPGSEHNFNLCPRARENAHIFCKKCPVPITFLGFEIGVSVITGGNLPEGDVLHQVLQDHGSANGRCSWDPMTALLAVIGDEEQAGYDLVRGKASVDPATGENYFEPAEEGTHCYVIKKFEDAYYEDAINRRIS